MTSDRHVLIVSTLADVATDEVVRRLTKLGISHRRLNTEDFPFSRTFVYQPQNALPGHWITFDGEAIPAPTSIWYRRLRVPPKPEGMDEGVYTFCLRENRAALLGSVIGLPGRWMSHPASVWQAEFKPLQLRLADQLGFTIPRTVITNSPDEIRTAFSVLGGRMVSKPARSGHVVHNGQEFAIFTSAVLENHLNDVESARWSPAIYQELVPKRFDLRITIVGRRVFAAAIESQSDEMAMIDWRRTSNPRLPHHPVSLPEAVSLRLLQMMDALHLTFGAIDMIQTPDNRYVFLEVNPSGQWLWLDDMLGLGISDCVAKWLAGS